MAKATKTVDEMKSRLEWLVKSRQWDRRPQLATEIRQAAREVTAAAAELAKIKTQAEAQIAILDGETKPLERYIAELKELLGAHNAASEAYITFRSALMEAANGSSAFVKLLRAESLRSLLFDANDSAKPTASLLQLKAQKLSGSARVKKGGLTSGYESISGGVILSYIRYGPDGKIIGSGILRRFQPYVKLDRDTVGDLP